MAQHVHKVVVNHVKHTDVGSLLETNRFAILDIFVGVKPKLAIVHFQIKHVVTTTACREDNAARVISTLRERGRDFVPELTLVDFLALVFVERLRIGVLSCCGGDEV